MPVPPLLQDHIFSNVVLGESIVASRFLVEPSPGYVILWSMSQSNYWTFLELQIEWSDPYNPTIVDHQVTNVNVSWSNYGPPEAHVFASESSIIITAPDVSFSNNTTVRHQKFTYGTSVGSLAASFAPVYTVIVGSTSPKDYRYTAISSTKWMAIRRTNSAVGGTFQGLYRLWVYTGNIGSGTVTTTREYTGQQIDASASHTNDGVLDATFLTRTGTNQGVCRVYMRCNTQTVFKIAELRLNGTGDILSYNVLTSSPTTWNYTDEPPGQVFDTVNQFNDTHYHVAPETNPPAGALARYVYKTESTVAMLPNPLELPSGGFEYNTGQLVDLNTLEGNLSGNRIGELRRWNMTTGVATGAWQHGSMWNYSARRLLSEDPPILLGRASSGTNVVISGPVPPFTFTTGTDIEGDNPESLTARAKVERIVHPSRTRTVRVR